MWCSLEDVGQLSDIWVRPSSSGTGVLKVVLCWLGQVALRHRLPGWGSTLITHLWEKYLRLWCNIEDLCVLQYKTEGLSFVQYTTEGTAAVQYKWENVGVVH